MKIPTTFIKNNGLKIAWLISGLFLIWVLYNQYRVIDEAIIRPPLVQENQVTARQSKINQKLLDIIESNHVIKKTADNSAQPNRNPFFRF